MRVKFLSNLGSMDAAAIRDRLQVEVNHRECVVGQEIELPDNAAAWLKSKYASLFEEVKAPAKVEGVSPKPTVAEKKDSTIKADAK